MFLRTLFMCILGMSFGLMSAGGVFTVLLSVGLIPRFTGKTHTGSKVFHYENMVILGTISGCIFSVFDTYFVIGERIVSDWGVPYEIYRFAANVFLIFYGLFAGIFVGCLAMAIAEMLNSIPIFARRVAFRKGLGIAVSFMALGKLSGSLFYFYSKIFMFGG